MPWQRAARPRSSAKGSARLSGACNGYMVPAVTGSRRLPHRARASAALLHLLLLALQWAPPPGGGAHAFLDVQYDPEHGWFQSLGRCDLYTQPLGSAPSSGWGVTCGLELLPAGTADSSSDHRAAALRLAGNRSGHIRSRNSSSSSSNVGAEHLLVQAVDCSGNPTAHGRDYFFVELARPGGMCAVRLPALHEGGGIYSFNGWRSVSPGPWTATFYLLATATPQLFDLRGRANMTSALFDLEWEYMSHWFIKRNTSGAVAVHQLQKTLVAQPPGATDNASDPRVASGAAAPATQPHSDRSHLPRCAMPQKGEWVHVPRSSVHGAACPPWLCEGNTSWLHCDDRVNVKRGFRHVYVPWACTYRLFSKEDAHACLAGKRVLLWGDSRVRHLSQALFDVLQHAPVPPRDLKRALAQHPASDGPAAVPADGGPAAARRGAAAAAGAASSAGCRSGIRPELAFGKASRVHVHMKFARFPNRIGIRAVLACWRHFEAALMDYDVILLGSADHDIATLPRPLPIHNPFNYIVHPAQAGLHVLAADSAGSQQAGAQQQQATAAGLPLLAPGDKCYPPAGNFSTYKYRPFRQYLDAVTEFASRLNATRARLLAPHGAAAASGDDARAASPESPARRRPATVFWLLTGNKPRAMTNCYANEPDHVMCMHAQALRLLRHSGVVPLDLATMEMDAPTHWWDDNVHIGRNPRNGLSAMTAQVVVNTLCACIGA